jgi:epoxyqueuosine reductase QueG
LSFKNSALRSFVLQRAELHGIDAVKFCSVGRYVESAGTDRSYLENFKTIISAALSYRYCSNLASSKTPGYIARYTSANFYKILSDKLKILGGELMGETGYKGEKKEFFRVFVNSKINDKACAYYSGLGYKAKNSLIMTEGWGIQTVIGELLVDLDIDGDDMNDALCIDCDACVKACPTQALQNYGSVDVSKCLQHLSTSLELPKKINDENLKDLWGQRFYGCTECVDACPKNIKHKSGNIKDFTGYIGSDFDVDKILVMKKGDYKKLFAKNQLSAGWVEEICLVRNALMSSVNQGKGGLVSEYKMSLKELGWDEHEKEYLHGFIDNFLNI